MIDRRSRVGPARMQMLRARRAILDARDRWADSPRNQPAAPCVPLPVARVCGPDLENFRQTCNLVSMTRKSRPSKNTEDGRRGNHPRSGRWLLQDAKARFSELVRRVRTDGPQLVTVHGRETVVVVSAEEFRRLKGNPTGKALVEV